MSPRSLLGAPVVTEYRYEDPLYGDVGRLEEVRGDGVLSESYEYDANGNRLEVVRPSGAGDVAMYDDQDRLNVYDAGGDVHAYNHNAAGDLVSKSGPAGTTFYDYDALGDLRSVTLPGGTVIRYILDPAGRRIGKEVDGVRRWGLLYQDSLNPVAQLDASGALVSTFVYGTRSNVPDYMFQGGRVYRIVSDHLGSPRLVIDAQTGAVAQRIDYSPSGAIVRYELTGPAGYLPIPLGFAGGLHDPDTGLVRFGARDYDPQTGRWTVKDPILFAGGDPNLYGYVLGDPVNWRDLDGEDKDTIGKPGPGECVAKIWVRNAELYGKLKVLDRDRDRAIEAEKLRTKTLCDSACSPECDPKALATRLRDIYNDYNRRKHNVRNAIDVEQVLLECLDFFGGFDPRPRWQQELTPLGPSET